MSFSDPARFSPTVSERFNDYGEDIKACSHIGAVFLLGHIDSQYTAAVVVNVVMVVVGAGILEGILSKHLPFEWSKAVKVSNDFIFTLQNSILFLIFSMFYQYETMLVLIRCGLQLENQNLS